MNKTGNIGENFATELLLNKRYKIIMRNYKKPWGEVDIIGEKNGIITFFEVKTSKYHPNPSFTPEIRVNWKKQSKLKKICETYLSEISAPKTQEWQIDVISVILNKDNYVHEIKHIENAVFERQY